MQNTNEYFIEGSHSLSGTIKASGNKNAALPCIAASLLSSDPIILRNVPKIEDVSVMLEVFQKLGGLTEQLDDSTLKLCTKNITTSEIPNVLAEKIRASILFAGPLVAMTGKAILPPPGGDVIGRRRLDTHFLALEELGAKVTTSKNFEFNASSLTGADIFLDEASVTATENAIMAAVTAKGRTLISNAASEPHVQDLCNMLVLMGAKIEGIGSNRLVINGVKKLGGCEFTLGSDYMEVGSFIGLAAATHSELYIEGPTPADLRPAKVAFSKLGITWEHQNNCIHVPKKQSLKINTDIGGMIPKIDDAPWPGFPPDLTSIITVVATQVEGTVLVHEKMFESRMFFVDMLIGMGARIVLCDPHRAVVSGRTKLKGAELRSPDVRAGMAMVIAAMCAEGKSVIRNIYQIERGYENLCDRLTKIGAKIKRA
ncbi:MAG: UDP-N-acetylglucosamine 1-carboxyvinyltransferase [Termitinemataceae bacterium]|nr:MAG: UDP-N-acetylglucosamine 1-carboxyvinyltransferase [Termitinemataceae bacterium]